MEIKKEYIDVEGALRRIGGNRGLYVRLLKQFVEGDHIGSLEAALEAKDVETAGRGAHSIKGICANLSLDKMGKIAATLEKEIKGGEDYAATLSQLKEVYETTAQQIALVSE